jgi:penicillin-binding protein 1A
MVGGVDYAQSRFNRAYQARRQPGSAFKPLVYAAALEQGVNPYDLRRDAAIRIGGWTPQNYGGGYRGMMTVERALRLSVNTVAIRLAQEAGLEHVASLARRFGLGGMPEHPGPAIALGAYEVTLLELTGAYQVFQSGGGRHQPYLISEIANGRGQVLYARPQSAPAPALGAFQAAQMVRMMQGVITDGTGRRAALGRPAAGKTGTSQNFRDAWFVGFTPDWVCGVWVGNDDNRPMRGVTGGEIPADIWRRFMSLAHKDLPPSQFAWAPPLPPPPPAWSPAVTQVVSDLPDEDETAQDLPVTRARVWLPGADEPEAYEIGDFPADTEETPPRRRLTWASREAE